MIMSSQDFRKYQGAIMLNSVIRSWVHLLKGKKNGGPDLKGNKHHFLSGISLC